MQKTSKVGGQGALKTRLSKLRLLILSMMLIAVPIVVFLFIVFHPFGFLIPSIFPVIVEFAGVILLVYTLLSLMNPRIEARLEPEAVPLGESARFSWRMHGASDRIRNFRILLRGQEEVRYQEGKYHLTEYSIFHWEILAKTAAKADMLQGEIAFAVPEFSMHSFEAENNRVSWTIIVHGDIPFWPDVRDEFTITVLPVQRKETA